MSLSDEFVRMNRGNLISPSKSFLSMILEAESALRKFISPKSIDENMVIDELRSSGHVDLNNTAQMMLIKRFVRARAHMHWKQLLDDHKKSKSSRRRASAI